MNDKDQVSFHINDFDKTHIEGQGVYAGKSQVCAAALHQTGQGGLLFIGEQVDPADVLEIKPQQIRGAAAAALTGPPGPSGLAGQKLAL